MIRFMHPEILWALAALPLLALIRAKRGPAAPLRFSSLENAKGLGTPRTNRAGSWLAALRLAVLAGLIIGLARPQMGSSLRRVLTLASAACRSRMRFSRSASACLRVVIT